MPQVTDRVRAAIRAYGAARHELVAALLADYPDQVAVVRRRGFAVITRGGSPVLVTGRAVIHARPKTPPPGA